MKRLVLVLLVACRTHYRPVEEFELSEGGGCATLNDQTHYCWGTASASRSAKPILQARAVSNDAAAARFRLTGMQLCDHAVTPADCEDLAAAPTSFASGPHHACVVDTAGAVLCRGEADHGRLGAGASGHVARLRKVRGVDGAKSVAVGDDFSCAMLGNSSISCWGDNTRHQLAQPDSAVFETPVPVVGMFAVTALGARADQACASLTEGGLRCWGSPRGEGGSMGRPGTVNNVPMPVQFP